MYLHDRISKHNMIFKRKRSYYIYRRSANIRRRMFAVIQNIVTLFIASVTIYLLFLDEILTFNRDVKNLMLGENGLAVILPNNMSRNIEELIEEGWNVHAFNEYVSDLISPRRSLPDVRHARCKESHRYLPNLPATSVVIIFHNEAWSTLLRTVHSVLDRSPERLLKEVILVDDFSDLSHLKTQLDTYLLDYPKVKVVRHDKREGLIRARLNGLQHVTAPVVTYLDSHCECTEGWLEPLLDRITRNPTTVVCPTIDKIDDVTFEYRWNTKNTIYIGGFNWKLQFRWHTLPESQQILRKDSTEAIRSPTMAGGLFAINKAFFEKLGTYDEGFDIWGGENLELSFKIWMCGGTLEILPCSHVGHVFRKRSPYKWRDGVNVLLNNVIRLSEVWLDEYSKFLYQELDPNYDIISIDMKNLSKRKALRRNLGCKSFKWYLTNVYPDMVIPGEHLGRGEIRNLGYDIMQDRSSFYCLDSDSGVNEHMKPVRMYQCHGRGQNQFWVYSAVKNIIKDDFCLDAYDGKVVLRNCNKLSNQLWEYNSNSLMIEHANGYNCLAIDSYYNLILEKCDENNRKQMWRIQNYNMSVSYKR